MNITVFRFFFILDKVKYILFSVMTPKLKIACSEVDDRFYTNMIQLYG